MKSEEELFDDAIRRKLSDARETPPEGLFNTIIPPIENKRRFLWIWITGFLCLVLTAGWYEFFYQKDTLPAREKVKQQQPEVSGQIQNTELTQGTVSHEVGNQKTNDAQAGQTAVHTNDDQLSANRDGNSAENQENYQGVITSKKRPGKELKSGYAESFTSSDRDDPAQLNPYAFYGDNKSYLDRFAGNGNVTFYVYPTPLLTYTGTELPRQYKRMTNTAKEEGVIFEATNYAVEIYAAMCFPQFKETKETNDTLAGRLLSEKKSNGQDLSGMQFGANVVYMLNRRVAVSAGLSYESITEDFNFAFREYYQELDVDTIQYYILFPFTPPEQVTEYDTSVINLFRDHAISQEVTYSTFYFDAGIRYILPAGRFTIEPSAGLSAALWSTVKGRSNFNTSFEEQHDSQIYDRKTEFAVKGRLSVGYALNEHFVLFVHGGYQHALNSQFRANDFYSKQKRHTSTGLGIRYNFLKHQAAKSNPGGSDIISK